jgi:hypothetical protein
MRKTVWRPAKAITIADAPLRVMEARGLLTYTTHERGSELCLKEFVGI